MWSLQLPWMTMYDVVGYRVAYFFQHTRPVASVNPDVRQFSSRVPPVTQQAAKVVCDEGIVLPLDIQITFPIGLGFLELMRWCPCCFYDYFDFFLKCKKYEKTFCFWKGWEVNEWIPLITHSKVSLSFIPSYPFFDYFWLYHIGIICNWVYCIGLRLEASGFNLDYFILDKDTP